MTAGDGVTDYLEIPRHEYLRPFTLDRVPGLVDDQPVKVPPPQPIWLTLTVPAYSTQESHYGLCLCGARGGKVSYFTGGLRKRS